MVAGNSCRRAQIGTFRQEPWANIQSSRDYRRNRFSFILWIQEVDAVLPAIHRRNKPQSPAYVILVCKLTVA